MKLKVAPGVAEVPRSEVDRLSGPDRVRDILLPALKTTLLDRGARQVRRRDRLVSIPVEAVDDLRRELAAAPFEAERGV